MYKLPAQSTATPVGKYNWALVAGPLSPLKPVELFPAIRNLGTSALLSLPAPGAGESGVAEKCLMAKPLGHERTLIGPGVHRGNSLHRDGHCVRRCYAVVEDSVGRLERTEGDHNGDRRAFRRACRHQRVHLILTYGPGRQPRE